MPSARARLATRRWSPPRRARPAARTTRCRAEAVPRLTAPAAASGERLDRFLAAHLALPRNQVQRWIEAGRVRLAGQLARASARLDADAVVEWDDPPPPSDERIEPEAGELRILHLD